MAKKSIIDERTVRYVANLSRIELDEAETKLYSSQLGDILGYIDKLNEINTEKITPTSHPLTGLKNVFRKDEVRRSLSQEEALGNAPEKKDSFFSVPKIIE